MSGRLDCPDEPEDFLCMLQQHRKNNPRNLITGSLNINSIRNKFDAVQHMLKCQYMDILALCETKLDDSFPIGPGGGTRIHHGRVGSAGLCDLKILHPLRRLKKGVKILQ